MNLERIIAQIDAEIARLTAARDALTGSGGSGRKRGRRKSRVWTASQRARQARLMKARWAKRKGKAKS